MILPYIFSVFLGFSSGSTQDYKSFNFRAPVDIPMFLAGNFGELRTNHFHTGIDIKTQGKEGFEIKSIEDGYISRINISHYGYGVALYVTHPNGFTSVYAHLREVNEEIGAFLEEAQYDGQTETIELYPGKDILKVKRGDVIALSGNSGSSGGPHLHFEIRETATEKPINPLLFGFDIKDDVKPIIKAVSFYDVSDEKKKSISVVGSNGLYQIKDIVTVSSDLGIGIRTYDQLSEVGNHCGIYSIQIFMDGEQLYFQEMDKLDFKLNRYINNHMDYEEFTLRKSGIHKCFIDGHNDLPIYKEMKSQGVINLEDSEIHDVKVIVKDAYGNASLLKFKMKSNGSKLSERKSKDWGFLLPHYLDSNGLKVHFPVKSFYNNVDLEFNTVDSKSYLSPIYQLFDELIPVHYPVALSIRVDDYVKDTYPLDKLIIVHKTRKGSLINMGGIYEDGYVKAEVKSMGTFYLYYDTIAPTIVDINKDSVFDFNETIDFKIYDNFSGLEDYDMYVDGKWVLSNFHRRTSKLQLIVKNAKISIGNHDILVKVKDERGNIKLYSKKIKITGDE